MSSGEFKYAITEFALDFSLEHFFGNNPYVPPSSSRWLALGANSETLTLTGEPTGNNYARLEIGGSTGRTWSTADPSDALALIVNIGRWEWNIASPGDWFPGGGGVNDWYSINVMDAPTGGNTLMTVTFVDLQDETYLAGEIWAVDPGDWQVKVDAIILGTNNWDGPTAYFANQVFQLVLNGDTTPPPNTNVYAGLLDNAPIPRPNTDMVRGIYSEVSGNGYARVEVGNDSPASGAGFNAAVDGKLTLSASATFPTITPSSYPNPVYYVGWFDEPTGGNLLVYHGVRDEGGLFSSTV